MNHKAELGLAGVALFGTVLISILLIVALQAKPSEAGSFTYAGVTVNYNMIIYANKIDTANGSLYYTPSCLAEKCMLPINISVSQDITIPDISKFTAIFKNKLGGASDKLESWGFEILQVINATSNITIFSNYCNPYNQGNGTVANCTLVANGSYLQYNQWNELREFNPSGKIMKAGKYYIVNLYGYRNMSKYDFSNPENNKIDAIFKIFNYETSELAWWSGAWNFKRAETITSVSGNLTDFMYLVNRTGVNGTIGLNKASLTNIQSGCADVRPFLDDETTLLGCEITVCNSTNVQMWVKRSVQSIGTNTSYLYYNSSGATTVCARGNATSANYTLDYHFDENIGTTINDSSQANNNGTSAPSSSQTDTGQRPTWVAGKFGHALNFDNPSGGSPTQVVVINNSASFSFNQSQDFTIEVWFKPNSVAGSATIVNFYSQSLTTGKSFEYHMDISNNNRLSCVSGTDNVDSSTATGVTTLETGIWYYGVCRFYGVNSNPARTMQTYLNGMFENSSQPTAVNGSISPSGYVGIGAYRSNTVWQYAYNGTIDEPRVSNVARSDQWINATYKDVTSNMGAEQTNLITIINKGISPANPNTTDIINASAVINFASSTVGNITFWWYKNTVFVTNNTITGIVSSSNITNLYNGTKTNFDNITAEIRPYTTNDGFGNFQNVTVQIINNFAPSIQKLTLEATGIDASSDIRLRINASDTDNNLDACFVNAVRGTFSNGICTVNIADTLSNSGILWVNDSSNANTSWTFNFEINISARNQNSTFANNFTIQRTNRSLTVANRDAVYSLSYEINVSNPSTYIGIDFGINLTGSLLGNASQINLSQWTGDWLTESVKTKNLTLQNISRTSNFTLQYYFNQTNLTVAEGLGISWINVQTNYCPNTATFSINSSQTLLIHNCSSDEAQGDYILDTKLTNEMQDLTKTSEAGNSVYTNTSIEIKDSLGINWTSLTITTYCRSGWTQNITLINLSDSANISRQIGCNSTAITKLLVRHNVTDSIIIVNDTTLNGYLEVMLNNTDSAVNYSSVRANVTSLLPSNWALNISTEENYTINLNDSQFVRINSTIKTNKTLMGKTKIGGQPCSGYIVLNDYCEFKDSTTTSGFGVTTTTYTYRIKAFLNVTDEAVSNTTIQYKFPISWLTDGYLDWTNRDSFYDVYNTSHGNNNLSLSEDTANATIRIGTNHTNSSLHVGEKYVILQWGKQIVTVTGTTSPPVSGGGGGGGGISCKNVNGTCRVNSECCVDKGLFCNNATNKCAKSALKIEGESCVKDTECIGGLVCGIYKKCVKGEAQIKQLEQINFDVYPTEMTPPVDASILPNYILIIPEGGFTVQNTGTIPFIPEVTLECSDPALPCPKSWCLVEEKNQTPISQFGTQSFNIMCRVPTNATIGETYYMQVCAKPKFVGMERQKCGQVMIPIRQAEGFDVTGGVLKVGSAVSNILKTVLDYGIICFGTEKTVSKKCLLPLPAINLMKEEGSSSVMLQGVGDASALQNTGTEKYKLVIKFDVILLDILYVIFLIMAFYLFTSHKVIWGGLTFLLFLVMFVSRLIWF